MLEKQVALVTGVSHANGIGAAVCRELAGAGVNIFFTHWEAPNDWPESFQQELQVFGIQCGHISADLSKSTVHTTILDAIEPQLGSPSILVNNAAYSTREDRKSTRLNSSHVAISYAVFCL